MARIICIASQKGGVGKTTTALNLGYSLSRLGSRVLLVDGDPQAGVSIATNVRKRTTKGLIDLIRGNSPAAEIVMETREPSFSVAGVGRLDPEDVFLLESSARGGDLSRAVRGLAADFDYVIVDAPAGVGGLVTGLLAASDSVILVVTPRLLSLTTLPSFLSLLRWVQDQRNPNLRLEGVLVTMYDAASAAQNEMNEELRAAFPAEIFFHTSIPVNEVFERASLRSIPVALLSDGAVAAKPYLDLAMELKSRELLKMSGGEDEPVAGLF
mgnify:CR=1 FL=1